MIPLGDRTSGGILVFLRVALRAMASARGRTAVALVAAAAAALVVGSFHMEVRTAPGAPATGASTASPRAPAAGWRAWERACRGARRLGARVSDTRDGEMCAALALHITELVPRNAGGCSACCDVRPACFITAEFACARAAGGSDAGDRRFWLRVAAVCNWWGPSARGALFVQPARDARGAASADSDGGMFPSRSFPGACACFKAGGCRELQPDE